MHLTKMEGLGNDYLYVFGSVAEPAALARRLSDRHFGIGADGLILIAPGERADFRMRIFNADGSEARMCGNGIRCVGKYVYDKGYTRKTQLTIETPAGVRSLALQLENGRAVAATVDMGAVQVQAPADYAAAGQCVRARAVDVGNPHAVIFVEDAAAAPVAVLGAALERHAAFPDGVNVEFVQRLSATRLRMRVWERGSGITMACGTGACASVAAAVAEGLCPPDTEIAVVLDGGMLSVRMLPDGHARMTGPANTVCECEVEE